MGVEQGRNIGRGDSLTITKNDRRYGIVVLDITAPLKSGARFVTGLLVGVKSRRPNQSNRPYKAFWTDEVEIVVLP
jgi:hypothetical protein